MDTFWNNKVWALFLKMSGTHPDTGIWVFSEACLLVSENLVHLEKINSLLSLFLSEDEVSVMFITQCLKSQPQHPASVTSSPTLRGFVLSSSETIR